MDVSEVRRAVVCELQGTMWYSRGLLAVGKVFRWARYTVRVNAAPPTVISPLF
jgi:hypothetical protein